MATTTIDRLNGINAGLAIKAPCRAATTANITLSAEQMVDGIALVTGDRVLVKDQTDTTGALFIGCGYASGATTFGGTAFFPVTMRAAPTITTYNPQAANANWYDAVNTVTQTATVGAIGDTSFGVYGSTTSQNARHYIHWSATAEL